MSRDLWIGVVIGVAVGVGVGMLAATGTESEIGERIEDTADTTDSREGEILPTTLREEVEIASYIRPAM
jgi:hypothetical protein